MRGEVVLITGGSGGIGLAAAHRFVREGARVVLVARDPERLAEAVHQVGACARARVADVTDPGSVQALAGALAEEEARIGVLVNCAGQLEVGPAVEAGPAAAERLVQINYLGTVRVIHACLPLLRRGERRSIVNVSSLAGKVSPPYMAAYAASKFALTAYTHALRQELSPEGFHVGLVSPGPVDTPMVAGRVRTRYYPLPPGVEVIAPEGAAGAILHAVRRRAAEVVVPRRLSPALRLGQAFPRLVDWLYRPLCRTERG